MNTNTMKSTLHWTLRAKQPAVRSPGSGVRLSQALQFGFRLSLAAVTALVPVIGAVWAVSAFENPYLLQAAIWAASFVFMALAVESRKPNVGALLATGLALGTLSILSARVTSEFAIVAALLIAAWIAAALLGCQREGDS